MGFGIEEWQECRSQVAGYKGNRMRSVPEVRGSDRFVMWRYENVVNLPAAGRCENACPTEQAGENAAISTGSTRIF